VVKHGEAEHGAELPIAEGQLGCIPLYDLNALTEFGLQPLAISGVDLQHGQRRRTVDQEPCRGAEARAHLKHPIPELYVIKPPRQQLLTHASRPPP
jgi:hypothetical protein